MDKKIVIILAVAAVAVIGAAVFLMNKDDDSATSRNGENADYGDETMYKGVMNIYGNADMNPTINNDDVKFVEAIVSGEKTWNKETNPFADANGDGQITQADVDHIKDLVNRKDGTKVRFVDGNNNITVATLPMKKIIMSGINGPGLMCLALGFTKKDVIMFDCFPNNPETPGALFQNVIGAKAVSNVSLADYDATTSAGIPDAIIYNNYADDNLTDEQIKKYKDAGIVLIPSKSMEGAEIGDFALALGYIFDKEEKAHAFSNWCNNTLDKIDEACKKVKTENYPSVLYWYGGQAAAGTDSVYNQLLKSMAAKNVADWSGDYKVLNKDNCAWILDYDPDYVFRTVGSFTYGTTDEALKTLFDTYGDMIKELDAYKEKKYVFVAGSLPQILRMAYLASYIHPDELGADFGDECHKELVKLYGIDFDVDSQPFIVDGNSWA